MKTFDAPSLHLETPDDWFDASTYILAAPRNMGFTPTVVVNVTRRVILPDLQRHIDQQVYEMQKLSGFRLVQRQPVTTTQQTQTGSIAFYQDNNKQGPELYQKQIYYMTGQTIWCLTATSPASLRELIMPSLESVMATFKPRDWEVQASA
jgi:hypothetical protein